MNGNKKDINKKMYKNSTNYEKKDLYIKSKSINVDFNTIILERSSRIYVCDKRIFIFKSILDLLILIYLNNNNIVIYNLIDNKIISEIKNSHEGTINEFDHYLELKNKRDLVISASFKEIKLWIINTIEYILNIKTEIDINSAIFLDNKNQCFIISAKRLGNNDIYKNVYDLKGKNIRQI